MISKNIFDMLAKRAKDYTYSSMNYIDFEDCKNAEILQDCEDMILLHDTSKMPAMLYFAVNNFGCLIKKISDMPGKLRLHFVPREFAAPLKELGFTEWGEYADFWNLDLANTAAPLCNAEEAETLTTSDCEEVSALSEKCRLQSRGFEGESPDWFKDWLAESKVLILRKNSAIIGYCCVSIYNEGTTLWIREVAIDPDHQGKGFGKKLMEQAIRYGASNGAVKGFLAADVLNKNAIGLYEKYGFKRKNTDSELQMIKG
ncbi:MAG: GNAT family N-acetyltransferase [Oscillospiraceae bacterium]|jgi:ribosomal protein S18 acetylase RimI-like enzyme|nr:GNAT family N-acetyltransferase [Oscillospiraceae bacterium]